MMHPIATHKKQPAPQLLNSPTAPPALLVRAVTKLKDRFSVAPTTENQIMDNQYFI